MSHLIRLAAVSGIPPAHGNHGKSGRERTALLGLRAGSLLGRYRDRFAIRSSDALASRVWRACGNPFANSVRKERASELPTASRISIARSDRSPSAVGVVSLWIIC